VKLYLFHVYYAVEYLLCTYPTCVFYFPSHLHLIVFTLYLAPVVVQPARKDKEFKALCFKSIFLQVDYCYDFALEQLKLHTL
jgi:hypothetical protein